MCKKCQWCIYCHTEREGRVLTTSKKKKKKDAYVATEGKRVIKGNELGWGCAILIIQSCRLCAGFSAVAHAWHQSGPMRTPEEPGAMQKWGHIFQHQCLTVYRHACKHKPTQRRKDTKPHGGRTFLNQSTAECGESLSGGRTTKCSLSQSMEVNQMSPVTRGETLMIRLLRAAMWWRPCVIEYTLSAFWRHTSLQLILQLPNTHTHTVWPVKSFSQRHAMQAYVLK